MNFGSITSKISGIFYHTEDKKDTTPETQVGRIMSHNVYTIKGSYDLAKVAKTMADKDVGCVIVKEGGRLSGIVTENDFLKKIVSIDLKIKGIHAKHVKTYPVYTIDSRETASSALKIMVKQRIRHIPVVRDGLLVGLMTEKAYLPIINNMKIQKSIEYIMNKTVVTAGGWYDCDKIAELMSEKSIGCVILMTDGRISGIVTERDILKKIVGEQKSATDIKVDEIATHHVKTIPSTTSISEAANIMLEGKFRRLPIVDNGKLMGILTQTDLIRYLYYSLTSKDSQETK